VNPSQDPRPEAAPATGVEIRPMEEIDVPAVVALLERALGPAPGGADRRPLFEWKHLANPFGRSVALVAESDGALVGVRTFMRWGLRTADGGSVQAVRAVDTATTPGVRRRGVFSSLTRAGLDRCRDEGVAMVFNTPNAKSLPGYLKMGWREVARWPMWLRVRRPVRLAGAALRRDLRSGPAVAPSGPDGGVPVPASAVIGRPGLEDLLAGAGPSSGLSTARSVEFLRWRYAGGPLPYHALAAGDPLRAVVIGRVRSRGSLTEAVVCEALCRPDAAGDMAGLLRAFPRLAGADHAVASTGPAWPARRALAMAGYRRLPRAGMTFVVRPVGGTIDPDPLDSASWSLQLGDLELF